MTADFVEKISRVRCLTPHFHLSMQSGSDRILGLMRRKYNRKMALENIARLRSAIKGVMLTTDFIVGFPGETDEDFELTMDFARQANFLDMHVFAYSKRSGTPAAAMQDQIAENIKKERSAALIALGKELTKNNHAKFVSENEEAEVLFETFEDGRAYGHTASFVPVCAESENDLRASFKTVRLTGSDGDFCYGKIIERS
jgi:threonylcarbamoyladenosine tRNA methylthiotransferase MtaB